MAKTKEMNIFGYEVKMKTVTMVVVIFAVALALLSWVLFTTWPAVHDPTHMLRHSLGFVPCH